MTWSPGRALPAAPGWAAPPPPPAVACGVLLPVFSVRASVRFPPALGSRRRALCLLYFGCLISTQRYIFPRGAEVHGKFSCTLPPASPSVGVSRDRAQ